MVSLIRGFITFPKLSNSSLNKISSSVRRYQSTKAAAPSFSYELSAAFSAKKSSLDLIKNCFHYTSFSSSRLRTLNAASLNLLKSARHKSGQDSFFIGPVGKNDSGYMAFGVADGVGGWSDSGIDSADFAHTICEYLIKYSDAQTDSDFAKTSPLELLTPSFKSVLQDNNVVAGGSTACVGVLTPTGELKIGNLGDSGYAHFSPYRLSHLSTPQTSAFNTPFQLTKHTNRMIRQMLLFGNKSHDLTNHPHEMDNYVHPVAHGDAILLATDGVWDNLFNEDLLKIVSTEMEAAGAWIVGEGVGSIEFTEKNDLQQGAMRKDTSLSSRIAKAIVREAKAASVNEKKDGPFAREVRQHFPREPWQGGKIDDICCVVAVVKENSR